MKLLKYRVIPLAFFLTTSFTILSQGWAQLNDFPSTARDDGTSFTINSTSYCGSGLNASWNPTNDFYAFDMTTESWSNITGLPVDEARQYANGFASDSLGYVYGGLNSSGYLNDLWQYDPNTDSWIELTPMPSTGRSGASCFVIGDTAYILGGQTDTNPAIDEVWAYSLTADSWTQKNNIPESLWRASSISFQGKGYVLFGRNNSLIYQNKVYEYIPSTDSWNSLTDFPGVGRTYVGLAILNNKLVTVAGLDSIGNSYNDMWKYSPSSDSWSLGVNLPSAQRRGGICFHSGTAMYYTTGNDLTNTRLTETWKFDLLLELDEFNMNEISLFPNPTNNELNILQPSSNGNFTYHILTIDGKIVQSGEPETGSSIDVSKLKDGHYLIALNWQSGTTTKIFVIY